MTPNHQNAIDLHTNRAALRRVLYRRLRTPSA